MRVLLAEDDPSVRKAIKGTLQSLGADVHDADDGEQALALLRSVGGFDILVTDIVMPGAMSGRDLACEVLGQLPEIRILFVSGYAHGRLDDANLEPGRTAFLPKPFTRAKLVAALGRLVGDCGGKER